MAIFTRQSLRLGPKVVPTKPVDLDPDHWATDHALNYLLLSRGQNADLTGNAKFSATDVGVQSSAVGPLAAFNGSTSEATVSNPKPSASRTVAFILQTTFNSQDGKYYSIGEWNNVFTAFQINGRGGETARFAVWPGNGGSYIQGNYPWFGYWNDGKPHVYVTSYDLVSKTLFTMIDGTVVASAATNGPIVQNNTTNLFYPGGNPPSTGSVNIFPSLLDNMIVLDRGVSQLEAFDFCKRPFAMLRPLDVRQYYVAASAVTPGTTRQPVIWFGM